MNKMGVIMGIYQFYGTIKYTRERDLEIIHSHIHRIRASVPFWVVR